MNNRHILLGRKCEQLAAQYLESINYKIIERNLRYRFGEIDIILLLNQFIVFAEVKHIGCYGIESLEQLISSKKRAKIISVAKKYLYERKEYRNLLIRFDVLGINADTNKVLHFKNAFGEKSLL